MRPLFLGVLVLCCASCNQPKLVSTEDGGVEAIENRPHMNPGDKFCLATVGFGGTRFYVVRGMNYPWVKASPNPDCAESGKDMTFWVNLDAVPAFSPDCVCIKKPDEL